MCIIKAVESVITPKLSSLIALFLLFSVSSFYAIANDSSVRPLISQKESLSKRPVVDVIQDSLGYIWFASSLDLTRYNGKSFQKYNDQNTGALRLNGNNIRSIHQRKCGNILVRYGSPHLDFIDYVRRGVDTAAVISLGKDNGVIGNRKATYIDEYGQIFCITELAGKATVYKLSHPDSRFQYEFNLPLTEAINNIDQFIVTSGGGIWLSLLDGRLFHFSSAGTLIKEHSLSSDQWGSEPRQGLEKKSILYEDKQGRIWYSPLQSLGLWTYHQESESIVSFTGLPAKKYYSHIWEDLVGNIMLGVSKVSWEMEEIYLIDEKSNVRNYSSLLEEYDKINAIYARDFSRLMFVGTFIGLKKVVFKNSGIRNYLQQELAEGEWGWSIRGMVQTNDGSIYLAREQEAWYRFDAKSESCQPIPFKIKNAADDQVLRNSFSLVYDAKNNCLWGTRRNGGENYFLIRYDLETQKFVSIPSPNFIQSLYQSKDGTLWVGCGKSTAPGELYAYDINTGQFRKFLDKYGNNPFVNTEVRYIYESKDYLLWLGTRHGLFQISKDRTTYKRYYLDNSLLINDNIICIVEHDNELLLGTEGGGINIFNPKNETVKSYTTKDGLASNYVSAIIPYGAHSFWLSTYDGLSYFDKAQKSFRNFYVDDGLSYNEFNRFSFLQDQDGLIYFGGMNGVNLIDPELLLNIRNVPKPKLCLQGLTRYNPTKNVFINNIDRLRKGKLICISPYDAYFQIDFFLPDYRHPDKNQYRYQLVGYDKSWNDLGNNNSIRYHDLPAGDFQLLIDAKSPGGQWGNSVQQLDIRVDEFFYKTTTAYFIYAVFLGLLFAGAYRVYVKRKLELAEAKRLKELDEFKSRFYANISHEFRTPLTLISGPLDRAIQQLNKDDQKHILEDLKIADRNSHRLLYLINRILDLSKLEAGKLETNYLFGDVSAQLRNLIHSFKSLLEAKHISLNLQIDMDEVRIDMDKQLLSHIITNLLSNAVKFTPEHGKIIVRAVETDSTWQLIVMDSGKGIPEDKLNAIFERFHSTKAQNALGTGIGLAFTKELVELMNGKIEVQNRPEGGAKFTVILPLSRSLGEPGAKAVTGTTGAKIDSTLSGGSSTSAKHPQNRAKVIPGKDDNDRPLVLVVEDQFDVAEFIGRCLQADYRIIKAQDGVMGIDMALEAIPDLIISDVMMPEKDGLELCNFLKNDIRSSHIPIILLTARADIKSRLAGLEKGADDYLSKPFHEKELQLRVANLLKSRVQLRQYYGAEENRTEPPEGGIDPSILAERAFMDKAKEIVQQHLLDNEFDIPAFCKSMGMSRTQLHRKLTAITGYSASNFINLIRLEKAKELLLHSDQSISDIAYATGFTDPSYFSRTFSKFHNCNPSEFRQRKGLKL